MDGRRVQRLGRRMPGEEDGRCYLEQEGVCACGWNIQNPRRCLTTGLFSACSRINAITTGFIPASIASVSRRDPPVMRAFDRQSRCGAAYCAAPIGSEPQPQVGAERLRRTEL